MFVCVDKGSAGFLSILPSFINQALFWDFFPLTARGVGTISPFAM
jgi:hypothetical protein